MDQSRLMILIIISLTTLSSGLCSEIVPLENWYNAQNLCRKNITMLTNVLYNAPLADGYYWTGYHIRVSQWIKIIGCFLDTIVKKISLAEMPFEMQFPSTGLCQEYCLKFNSTLFGVKSNKCVCLRDVLLQGNLEPDDCPLSCESAYSNETSIKFLQDCGGENTYNVFKTEILGFFKQFVPENLECLSIQCSYEMFIPKNCGTDLNQVCNKSVVHDYARNWNLSSKFCKTQRKAYLFGDVPITDVSKACEFIERKATGPTWLGIAKEKYISMDGVSDYISLLQGIPLTTSLYPKRCLKCNSSNCMFTDCVESNNVVCLQKATTSTTSTTTTTTTTTKASHTAFSTTMTVNESFTNTSGFSSTTHRNSVPIIAIALPVTIFITVGSVVLILGILWKRRQTEKITKTRETQHDTDSPQYSDKKKVEHTLPNNYFVLANTKSDSSVDSEKYTTDKYGENMYNESSDGDYDHLGGNIRKIVEEDTYHHAFFSSNEDESDYGVKNINKGNLTENPYDHTNAGTYQTTMSDNEYSTISLNR